MNDSYCPESVQCWRDIQRFKKTKRSNRRKPALHILNTYLTSGAPLELNMPKIEEHKSNLLDRIETKDIIPHTIFNFVQEHCLNDMTDVFERLRSSNKQIAEVVRLHKQGKQ